MAIKKHGFFKRNGLSIVLFTCFIVFLFAQYITGWMEYNEQRADKDFSEVSLISYLYSGHFIQATFENWESEFFQMAIYILFTVILYQKGSAESKKIDQENEVDREPVARAGSPWPVKKGGAWLWLYKNSLSIAFILLFIISFLFHFYGSLKDQNLMYTQEGKILVSAGEYIREPRFWFESFQNWQSEFLAVFSIVVLSIWLRQKGSPESKPVDASDDDTSD